MTLRGIVRAAGLEENPPGSEAIEMVVKAQGVGRDQPRSFVVPYDLLLRDDTLDPETIQGRSFEAEVDEAGPGRWVASSIRLAARSVLRPEGS